MHWHGLSVALSRLQGHQPVLEQLHLSGNQLTLVQPPPDDTAFPLLRTLLLAGNKIADWCEQSNFSFKVATDTRDSFCAGHPSTH